jgi:hypothetical protein
VVWIEAEARRKKLEQADSISPGAHRMLIKFERTKTRDEVVISGN